METPALTPALIEELRSIVGPAHVIADERRLLVYECDAYTLEKHPPHAVVLPRTTQEVAAVVKLCARHGLPIIPRGAG
jgi:glycolate oxidase